jgi:class 3 adenylate cyclase/tRNA A-37 threonylcarbamoyl transferase component Bud32/tetratricopeptide (TPR) repeat protein
LAQDSHLAAVRAALADRYDIERELGSGAFATVYLADDLKHPRRVAVKVLKPELAAAVARDRFLLEIKLTAQLNHPHILPLLDSDERGGFLFYVMPYVAQSLRQRLRHERQLSIEEAVRIARELAGPLAAAHAQGILHRDIKPENILLHQGHAMVADFGIARALTNAGGDGLSTGGLGIGTPGYMSPEQATAQPVLDQRTDVYSLGCVLYEMLAGETPYTGPSAQAIIAKQLSQPVPSLKLLRETVPAALDAAIRRALAKVPADRYPDVGQFARALGDCVRGVSESGWAERTATNENGFGGPGPSAGYDLPADRVAAGRASLSAYGRHGESGAITTRTRRQLLVEQRRVTVLACKLENASELDPQKLRTMMAAYRKQCVECIEAPIYDGHVSEQKGDTVVALFGFPVVHENSAERAVRAGLQIIKRLATPEAGQLKVRIGVARGRAVLSPDDEWVEAKDLAAQLRDIAEPGTVVVSKDIKLLARGAFDYRDLGEQPLRGSGERVHAFAIVEVIPERTRLAAATIQGLTPFVGRPDAIAVLEDRWRRSHQGHGQVVLLIGEAGIGKSRIVNHFREERKDVRIPGLLFQCSEYHVNTAFHPVIDYLERELAFEPNEPAASRLAKLRAFAVEEHHLPDAKLPYLAAVLSIPGAAAPDATPLSPERRKEETISALVDLILAVALKRNGMIVFEDVHWADPTTMKVLDAVKAADGTDGLIERVMTLNVLIVVTTRPPQHRTLRGSLLLEPGLRWQNRWYVEVQKIPGLLEEQARELVLRLAHDKPLPPKVVDGIVHTADGVPFHIEEVTKAVLESGDLKDEGTHYAYAGERADISIPATLEDSLMARLDGLSEAARNIADIGAVIGAEFSQQVIADVAQLPPQALSEGLEELTASELAFRKESSDGVVYRFKHALVQKAAYDSIRNNDPHRLQELHSAIARELGALPDAEPELIAYHYTQAGQVDKAIPRWLQAGQLAQERYALSEAVAHLRKGLSLIPGLPSGQERDALELKLRELLGLTVMALHGWAAAEVSGLLEPALDIIRRSPGHRESYLPILHGLWVHFMSAGQHTKAVSWAKAMEAQAADSSSEDLRIVALRTKMTSHFWMGDLVTARREAERIEDLYDSQLHARIVDRTNTDPRTAAGIYRSQILWMLGYPDQAIELSDRKDRHARDRQKRDEEERRTPHPLDFGLALTLGAEVFDYCGEAEQLQARAHEAKVFCDRHSYKLISERMAPIMMGIASLRAGRVSEAVRVIQESLARLTETGHRAWVPYVRAVLGEARARNGERDEGLRCIEESLSQIEIQRERVHLAEVLRLKAWILMQHGRIGEAEGCLRDAIAVARQQRAKSWELRATITLAQLLADRGDRSGAYRILRSIYRWFKEGLGTRDLKQAKALLDALAP